MRIENFLELLVDSPSSEGSFNFYRENREEFEIEEGNLIRVENLRKHL